jgi:hypothetical protein
MSLPSAMSLAPISLLKVASASASEHETTAPGYTTNVTPSHVSSGARVKKNSIAGEKAPRLREVEINGWICSGTSADATSSASPLSSSVASTEELEDSRGSICGDYFLYDYHNTRLRKNRSKCEFTFEHTLSTYFQNNSEDGSRSARISDISAISDTKLRAHGAVVSMKTVREEQKVTIDTKHRARRRM